MSIFLASTGFAAATTAILALATMGFTMQFGVSNIVNVAYGDLMTASAYIAYTFVRNGHWSLWWAAPAGVVGTGVLTALMNHFIIRPFVRKGAGPFTMLIVTFAMGSIIANALLALYGPSFFSFSVGGNQQVLNWGGLVLTQMQVATIIGAVVIMLLMHTILTRTTLGKSMRALADNMLLTRSCGVRTEWVLDFAWLLSGCLCGLAGLALAFSTSNVSTILGEGFLFFLIPAAFLGGIGSPFGAVAGAAVIGFISEWTAALIGSEYKLAVALAALVAVIVLRPSGIVDVAHAKWSE